MPKLVVYALTATLLGLVFTFPCLLRTTPLTMVAFFCLGIPLFTVGFVLYVVVVIRDLRHHEVI